MKKESNPGEFTPLGNDIYPDEKTLEISKEITSTVINKLGPVKELVKIIDTELPVGQLFYLSWKDFRSENEFVEVITKSKFFQMENYSTTTEIMNEQINDLTSKFGVDIVSMMKTALLEEHVVNIAKQVLDKIITIANKNIFDLKDTFWQKTLRFFLELFGKNYVKCFKVNDIQKLVSRILAAGNMIALKGRRGPATYMICSSGMASLLSDCSSYVFNTNDDIPLSHGLDRVGSIANIQILVNRRMKFDDMSVYVGRTGLDGEPGIYMPIMNTGTYIINNQCLQTSNQRISMFMRRCIISTEECDNIIAELKFKLTGNLRKKFLGK